MKSSKKTTAFVAWMKNCRRSIVLADYLGAETLFLSNAKTKTIIGKLVIVPVFYILNTFRTLAWLLIKRPGVVFVQAPPIFCPLFCFLYTGLFNKRLVIDCHNAYFDNFWPRLPGFRWLLEKGDIVLGHNEEYVDHLKEIFTRATFFALEDRLLDDTYLSFPNKSLETNLPYILVVVSFSHDEPVEEILLAAGQFLKKNPGISFKVTGNYKKNIDLFTRFSTTRGIEFLGYVDDPVYFEYLKNARAAITLSRRDMIQQCASVEALSFEIPVILQKSRTNKRLFGDAAVYTDIQSDNILEAYHEILCKRDVYRQKIIDQKQNWHGMWANKVSILRQRIMADE